MDNLRMPKRKDGPKPVERVPQLGESPVLARVRELVLNGQEGDPAQWGTGWTLKLIKEFRLLHTEARDLGYEGDASQFPEILWQVEKLVKGLQKVFEEEGRGGRQE